MKKEPCLRLDEIASALSQADAARMAPELSPADRVIMEQACVTLRRRCITMLQSFSRAHSALLKEMDYHATYSEFMDELYELNKQIVDIAELL